MRSETVSRHLQSILADCDLVVGTEEEIHIAAGSEDTLEALRIVRALSKATIVLKRGPMGCVVYPDAIPARIEDGIKDVMGVMTRSRIRHLPVTEAGRLAGIVSIGDVVKNRLEEVELEANVLREAYIALH